MIELFDAPRLLPRRDASFFIAGAVLAAGLTLLGLHGASLQRQLQQTHKTSADLQRLAERQAAAGAALKPPSAELLADLRRQAERLEAELSPGAGSEAARLTPALWLEALAALGSSDVGVLRAEVGRDGVATLDGQALNPEAVTRYLGAWERHDSFRGLLARALELREDKERSGLLHFTLRTLPRPAADTARPASPAASSP
ncbi:MAG: hypothetical protein JNJ71_07405 [Rubrivivax sp.]|nr:hypothetical protein [Rubrivivax sp.]